MDSLPDTLVTEQDVSSQLERIIYLDLPAGLWAAAAGIQKVPDRVDYRQWLGALFRFSLPLPGCADGS